MRLGEGRWPKDLGHAAALGTATGKDGTPGGSEGSRGCSLPCRASDEESDRGFMFDVLLAKLVIEIPQGEGVVGGDRATPSPVGEFDNGL